MLPIDKWDHFGLELADQAASMSKDPSTRVGAAILRPDRTVASLGYNGFPRGVEDSHERLNCRETKYAMVVHAEVNAMLHAREPLHGMTMYTTLPPCSGCAGMIIQAGLSRVVSRAPTEDQMVRWRDSLNWALAMFDEVQLDMMWVP